MTYDTDMVTRIRRGDRPHLYILEHMKARRVSAEQMAGRLGMTRESVYRAIREQKRISVPEMAAWASALGLDHWQDLTHPPEAISVDARMKEIPDDLRDVVMRMVRKAS